MIRIFLSATTPFLLLTGLLLSGIPAYAKEKEDSVLLVISAGGADIADGRLTMKSVDRHVLAFTDRPTRKAGRVPAAKLAELWSEGRDSLASDPPNAVLVGEAAEDAEERLVVELKEPRWQDGNLVFDIAALRGTLPPTASYDNAALFIDNVLIPFFVPVSSLP